MAPVSHLRPGTQDQQRSQISARLTSLVQAADAAECSSQFDPRVGLRPRAAQTASQTITEESRCQVPPGKPQGFSLQKGLPPLNVQNPQRGVLSTARPQGRSCPRVW